MGNRAFQEQGTFRRGIYRIKKEQLHPVRKHASSKTEWEKN